MNRFIRRGLVGLAVVGAVGLGLTWGRPYLFAAVARVRDFVEDKPGPDATSEAEAVRPHAEAGETTVDDGWCAQHRRPEADCVDCRRGESRDEACREKLPVIQLDSIEVARQVGIATAPTRSWTHAHMLAGNAETAYAAHDYAHILPRVSGRIIGVPTDEGEQVKKGQVLVVVDSADVGTYKANYLAALPVLEVAQAAYDRTSSLVRKDAAPKKDELEALGSLNKAKADVLNAKQKLKNLGFTDEDLERIRRTNDTATQIEIRSPMAGRAVERHAVNGEAVQPTTDLFELADLSHLWCWIDVYENEIDEVKIGQPVRFVISGTREPVFHGKVELIGFAVNPATRTVRVRAELENPDGRLRANQFGRAEIQVEPEHPTVLVPSSAVQKDGKADLVFLPRPDGRTFVPQRIVARPMETPEYLEVAWGLGPGQPVVTTGSFLLKSEMLRDEIGGD